VTSKADVAVGGYLRGQVIVTSLVGMTIWIGLSILGVPLALAISVLAAIFNLVPYLGPIIGVIPAVLLGFSVSPLTGILAAVVFIIANQLESNLLSPLILSKNVNIHPVTVLLAILAGFSLYGFVGALLAVPAVALFKILYETYVMTLPAYQSGPFRHRTNQPPAAPDEEEPGEPRGTP
jgi:predicted PurR-regulated permease PerM